MRIVLDRDQFETLINGKTVFIDGCEQVDDVEINLEDIGFDVMARDIVRATNPIARCQRCDLPVDNFRGAYVFDGMDVCHRCITDDERTHALVARGIGGLKEQ